jgi:site-specific DNA-cytosine methylase
MKPRTYKLVTFFCGSGAKTLGVLRARGRTGSRFKSVGAFDIDPIAVADFELLTGAKAEVVDLGVIQTDQLASRCSERPDMIVMSPPCKGFSGCLPEGVSESEKYQLLNKLALRSIDLAVETWSPPPALIMLENVPRMRTRGADLLEQMIAVLRAADYEVDLRSHDCGEWGGLAQKRERLLLIARHRGQAPSHLMQPPSLGLKPMSSVLWTLPPPIPGSRSGGPHHRLPRLSELNWLRLASIPAGQDWRAIPERVRMAGVFPRLPDDGKRHAGKYGPQDPGQPAHAVLAEARTGKGWADVADPRCGGDASGRQSGLYGVCSNEDPSHTIVAAARAGSHSWASLADPRLGARGSRQNGGRGVNDSCAPAHAVMAEGSVSNTWSSVSDPRLDCSPHQGTMGVRGQDDQALTVRADTDIHNSSVAVADPRSDCSRREDSLGVSDPSRPYKTSVIGHQKIENSPTSVADHRVINARVPEQNRGNFGVQDASSPSATVRASHPPRTAPSSVSDARPFSPTHHLIAGRPWSGDRDAWVRGDFVLVGPEMSFDKAGRPKHVIILAPDNTIHRPMTTAELMLLQGFPVWHRPGDPTELAIGEDGGQWVQLHGNNAQVREHVGNAVPVPTAQAIGAVSLELLDSGGELVFQLSAGGVWVQPPELPSDSTSG